MSAQYIYSPLRPDQLRLSQVTKVNDQLHVSLKEVDFDAAPEYTAISYCWEGQQQDDSVVCDGRDLKVTPNVVTILDYLATAHPNCYFWIDALCINQDDHVEKKTQVPLMGKIYETAKGMLAWIGRIDEDIKATIQDLPNMFAKARDHVGSPMNKDTAHWAAYGIPTKLPSVWFGLYKMLLQPWFRRLWAVQEVVLPKEIGFVCGGIGVDARFFLPLTQEFSRFTTACIVEVTMPTGDFWKALSCFANVCQFRRLRQNGTSQPFTLPDLLLMTEPFLVSDLHDRIYALLGITNPLWRKLVTVSYETPIAEVYIDFARSWIFNHPRLLLLNRASSRPPMEGLPSWCPVFHEQPVSWTLGAVYELSGYSAGIVKEKSSETAVKNIQTQDVELWTPSIAAATSPGAQSYNLRLKGFQIGYVDSLVSPGSLSTVLNLDKTWHPNSFLAWEAECLRVSQLAYEQPDSIPPAHARTLVANKNMQHRRCSNDIVQAYKETIMRLKSHSSLIDDVPQGFDNYYPCIEFACYGRSFFSTSNGMVGVGPGRTEKGDVVCTFDGCVTPFVIRRIPDSTDMYEFLGEAYVDGIMYGEALETDAAKNMTEFILV